MPLRVALAFLLVAGQACGQTQALDEQEERWIIEAASDFNRLLPRQVDAETRLDAITAGPGRRLNYQFTLLDQTRSGIDIESFNAGIQPLLRDSICRDDGSRQLLNDSVTLSYDYRGATANSSR
ncbi:MAG: hypothetical protein EXR39_10505 [Betaproteobacteria bacterium]|nr:hypothetical protein [Betaproteobacteria bacterium]